MSDIPTLQFEALKSSYRQSKDGFVIGLVIHPQEMPSELANAKIGTRYQCVLVELADDETPAKPEKVKPEKAPREWQALSPTTQAGIRCEELSFVKFLSENYPTDWHESMHFPEECVRLICGVTSRKELETNHAAKVLWHQLDLHYQAWMKAG